MYTGVPAFSQSYSEGCGSKAGCRCKVGQEKCRSHNQEHPELSLSVSHNFLKMRNPTGMRN